MATLVALALMFCSATAWAQEAVVCETVSAQVVDELAPDTGVVRCQVDAALVFDSQLRDVLDSGFTNNLLYRVYLYREGVEQPIAIAVIAFAEVFHLYSDVYYISREGVDGYAGHDNWDDAVGEMSRFDVILGTTEELEPGQYLGAVMLEINPMSQSNLDEARAWISRSRGGYELFGSSEQSFFGSFGSLFVDADQGEAEATRRFQSQSFELAP